jgi:hypothetical protein
MTIEITERSDPNNHYAMRLAVSESAFVVPGNGVGYDKPIAVLVGPGALSAGDLNAFRITFHPRVKTFGQSTSGAFGSMATVGMPTGWYAGLAAGNFRLASDSNYYLTHREFPVDVPVWHTPDAVANGEDAVVEAAMAWIDSTAGTAEQTPSAEVQMPTAATIVHGALRVPASSLMRGASCALLDISGRKVLALHPGANDVRGLAPGVYFVRAAPQASSGKPQAVRKVVKLK